MLVYFVLFISMIFFNLAIFVDNFLSNKKFNDSLALLFYGSITNLIFLPLVWIFGLPKILPSELLIPIIIAGFSEFIYLLPYYKALQK